MIRILPFLRRLELKFWVLTLKIENWAKEKKLVSLNSKKEQLEKQIRELKSEHK